MLKKSPSKTGRACRVTFRPPAEVIADADSVSLLGEFNDWSPDAHPLEQRRDGSFSTTVSLAAGRSYRFRYLVDGERWENDDEADELVPNRFGSYDSVVEV